MRLIQLILKEQYVPDDPAKFASEYEDESYTGSVDDFTWRYEPQFPISTFLQPGILEQRSKEHWAKFIHDEIEQGEQEEGLEFWSNLLAEPVREPIVVAFTNDGRWDLWDGWHRVGAMFATDRSTIPAVVGTPKTQIRNVY